MGPFSESKDRSGSSCALPITNGALLTVPTRRPAHAYEKLRKVATTKPLCGVGLLQKIAIHQDATRLGSEQVGPPAGRRKDLERAVVAN